MDPLLVCDSFLFDIMLVVAQVTCLTLALMSHDRYQIVVHPMRSLDEQKRLRLMLVAILITWIGMGAHPLNK